MWIENSYNDGGLKNVNYDNDPFKSFTKSLR